MSKKRLTKEEKYYDDYYNFGMNEIENDKPSKLIIITDIIFVFLIALLIAISIDIIFVAKYNKGPYFAIKTTIYNDGGTEVYHGLGYKVIKYHEKNGRQGMVVGSWKLSYSVEPTELSLLDLAIQFRNVPEYTANKFAGEYVKLTGDLFDQKNNKLILEYKDLDEKYTLRVNCSLNKKQKSYDLNKNKELTVLGTIENFTLKTKNNPNIVNMSNCFILE